MTNELRFFYNGIKAGKEKLQKAWYSDSPLTKYPAGTITIYAREYSGFSAEVRAAFTVENNTDLCTDYFETDSIRVIPSHPLYAQVKAALDANKARNEKRWATKIQPVIDSLPPATYGGIL